MATVTFDIQRLNDDYVVLRHATLDKFEYNYHSMYLNWAPKHKFLSKIKHKLFNSKYNYMYVALYVDKTTKLPSFHFHCNHKYMVKQMTKKHKKAYGKYDKILRIPWQVKERQYSAYFKEFRGYYVENDLKDMFKIYLTKEMEESVRLYIHEIKECER